MVEELKKMMRAQTVPLREKKQQALYEKIVSKMSEEDLVSEAAQLPDLFAVWQDVNLTLLKSSLHQFAGSFLASNGINLSSPVTIESVKKLKLRLETELLQEASKCLDISFKQGEFNLDVAQKLSVHTIATSEIRAILPHLIKGRADLEFATKEAVASVYAKCAENITGKTQTEIFMSRKTGELRPHFEDYFERLLDLKKIDAYVEMKLIHKLCKERFKHLREELERVFFVEVTNCLADQRVDAQLDTASEKGKHMAKLVALARSVQPEEPAMRMWLACAVDVERPEPSEAVENHSYVTMECVCRLYIGLLNLQNVDSKRKINTHPEVYLWMHRVLKRLYGYENPKSYFENRFLNVMNHCVAQILHRKRLFDQRLQYILEENERIPNSTHNTDFIQQLQRDAVRFRYLSEISIASMLQVSGIRGREEFDQGMAQLGVDFSLDALIWRGDEERSTLSPSSFGNLATIPLAIVEGALMIGPLLAETVAQYFKTEEANRRIKEIKAECIGVLLGLLLIHKKITNRFQSLFGFCAGAQIVCACLTELACYNRKVPEEKRVYILDVILYCGAVEAGDVDWDFVREPVRGRFLNIHSSEDTSFFRCMRASMQHPIGCFGIHRDDIEDQEMESIMTPEVLHDAGKQPRKMSPFKIISKLMNYYP